MLFFNGLLAKKTSPTWSSLVVHALGTITAGVLVVTLFSRRQSSSTKAPIWSYLGGIPGALTVIIANIAVNSQLGLSGTLALMLLGQTIFGLLVDSLGLFQMKKRVLTLYDFFEVLTIMAGSAVLIFFAR